MVLYFVLSNSITTGIQLIWRIPALRRLFNVGLPKSLPGSPAQAGQQGFMANFMNAYKTVVKDPASSSGATGGVNSREYERNLRKALRR